MWLRLLLAFGSVAVLSTVMAGWLVRTQWRATERQQFLAQVQGAREGISLEIQDEQLAIQDLLRPLCKHDALVDRTRVDIDAGRLDSGRRVAIAQLAIEEMKALRLDELVLLTGKGEILGAGHDRSMVGTTNKALAQQLAPASISANASGQLRVAHHQDGKLVPSGLVGTCVAGQGANRVGLIGVRYLTPRLERIAKAYRVRIAVVGEGKVPIAPDEIAEQVKVGDRAQLELTVIASRKALDLHLQQLDRWVLMNGAITLAVAILLALVLARSLGKPLSALATQVSETLEGQPRPLTPQGTPEMRKLARAFNKTLQDLVALRKRQAAIERIAAWREVARRVAHEIKNPLTPIRSSVETMRRLKLRNDPKFDEYFEEASTGILDQVHRIATIASDFARFARLPSPEPTFVDMAETIRTVVSMHASEGVDVKYTDFASPKAWVDRDQLGQVVTNLLQNSIDAVRQTTKNPRVSITTEPWGDTQVRLRVLDNGPGVAPEFIDNLFKPYATTKAHGTGLGLSIVQRIVIEHGGEIVYESQQQGACFSVYLPCVQVPLLPSDSIRTDPESRR